MAMQAVTPEELDAWLRTTEVTEEEEGGTDSEPMPIDAPPKQDQHIKKKKAWRRRSSLDEDNISSRPCFGVDAEALLANARQEETGGEISPSTHVNPYLKRASEGSSTVVASNKYPRSSDHESDIVTFKKRRVTGTSQDYSQFSRQDSTFSRGSIDSQCSSPYFRLVTDDSFKLDQEAKFSRHASQFSVPEHTMDQEARFSRRSSQFTVSQIQNAQGVESFLRAMEVSQRSHKMLMNQLSRSGEDRIRPEAMRESEESRSLLVRLSRRTVVKSMVGGMNSAGVTRLNLNSLNCGRNPTSMNVMKNSNQDKVAADLRRMEAMIWAEQEQQLGRIRSEFC
jgi:hypothetical protein